jgi:hypothetical protein
VENRFDDPLEKSAFKSRNWRHVLKALLKTSAPNNPKPPAEEQQPPGDGGDGKRPPSRDG